MDKNLKRKELMALGVHDLRNIARRVGVIGPTMKVKDQLVEEIIEIMSGDLQATHGVKRGRKAKANFLTGEAIMSLPPELSAIFQAREQKNLSFIGNNLGYLSLNQESTSSLIEMVEKRGFLLCENGVFYFFDDFQQKSMIYLPISLCENYDLKIGDKVLAKCQKMPGNAIYMGKDIISINGVDVQKYKRNFCFFDNLATTSTKWFCDDITEGDLNIISAKKVKDFLKIKAQLFNFCEKNKIFVCFFDIDCSITEQEAIENNIHNSEILHSYQDDPEMCFELFVSLINNAIVRAESGEKVLVVLYNFEKIYNTLTNLTKSTNLSLNDLQQIAEKVQNLNRILKNNGSLTSIIVN